MVANFIEDSIPTTPVPLKRLTHLQQLPLADPTFHVPGKLDLLLGAALWPFIIKENVVFGPQGTPTAMETSLGYLVMGEMLMDSSVSSQHHKNFCAILEEPKLDHLVQRFWSLEDLPNTTKVASLDDKECEDIFQKSYRRDLNGKFSVALPFKHSPTDLVSSKKISTVKYLQQEKRLLQKPEVHSLYQTVMQEYVDKGYISWVSGLESAPEDAHYLPHHGVYKPESKTTPLRIVFNGSSPTSNGKTLNSLLHVGPKLYSDIFDLLLNFRLFEYAISADVSKMYLQIGIHPEHRKYQRLIWRPSMKENLQVYELNVVVFGLTSSPFLAQRVVQELANLESSNFPLASDVVSRDIYMDDIVTSTDKEDIGIQTCKQLQSLFRSGGFTLSKWCSNSINILETTAQDLQQNEHPLDLNKELTTKVLGVQWLPKKDELVFKTFPLDDICTKRTILSVVARTFDVLGLIAPVLITAKILIQELWSLQVGWDDTPPLHIEQKWKQFCDELSSLNTLKIPRHSSISPGMHTSLIGFADASEKAYGAAVYVRTLSPEGVVQTVLLCAKSKVAPLKLKSIPRLELCAALLLSRLMRHVVEVFQKRHIFDRLIAFSDSTVVLHWIHSNPARWKVFVGNRISQIQENLDSKHWNHVPGSDNPSDCLSRGLTPSQLLKHPLWFHGPPWLKLQDAQWPKLSIDTVHEEELSCEAKKSSTTTATSLCCMDTFPLEHLLDKVSSFKKLLNVTIFVLRFIEGKSVHRFPITPDDVKKGEEMWIKFIQHRYFKETIEKLKNHQTCEKKLRNLDPFLEKDILRVGRRLNYSDLPYNQNILFFCQKIINL